MYKCLSVIKKGKILKYSHAFSKKNFSEDIISTKEKLIQLSLLNVDKFGWTEASIKLAANEMGYTNTFSSILSEGPADLIFYILDLWNNKILIDLKELSNNKILKPDEKIKKAIKIRLGYEIPLINTWHQAIKIGMNPRNIPTTINKLSTMTNAISSLENQDEIINSEKASKRIFKNYIIFKTFALCEMHLLTDKSFNYESTWETLDKIYAFNKGVYDTFEKVSSVNSSLFKMFIYSMNSLAPYDISKADEMMKLKFDEELNKNKI